MDSDERRPREGRRGPARLRHGGRPLRPLHGILQGAVGAVWTAQETGSLAGFLWNPWTLFIRRRRGRTGVVGDALRAGLYGPSDRRPGPWAEHSASDPVRCRSSPIPVVTLQPGPARRPSTGAGVWEVQAVSALREGEALGPAWRERPARPALHRWAVNRGGRGSAEGPGGHRECSGLGMPTWSAPRTGRSRSRVPESADRMKCETDADRGHRR